MVILLSKQRTSLGTGKMVPKLKAYVAFQKNESSVFRTYRHL